jgi:DNA-binding NarL/FixJ family response regulator
VVLTHGMPNDEAFTRWRVRHSNAAWVLVVDPKSEGACFEALHAGVSAILPPSADLAEIAATIRIVAGGLVVFRKNSLRNCLARLKLLIDGRVKLRTAVPDCRSAKGPS